MIDIRVGDCRDLLRAMPDASVHMCVTSPPYWGQRDYGVDGMIGLEASVDEWVAAIVEVASEVRRVLRDDGTFWLNLGDKYNSPGPNNHGKSTVVHRGTPAEKWNQPTGRRNPVLKPKDLMGLPWRVAFALQADGWWLRSDIIWAKPNPMPSSVTDRPSTAHEYVFLLTKAARYFYDTEAVREPVLAASLERCEAGFVTSARDGAVAGVSIGANKRTRYGLRESFVAKATRNHRSVWTIPTAPFPGEHFATYPPKLVEPCIKAGTSEHGVCAECGAPFERGETPTRSTGWRATCAHDAERVPATVLDPFSGAGTTGLVAQRLGRNYIGLELNPTYAEMSRKRIADDLKTEADERIERGQ
ncbi:MAG: site-specific DNA-methyltransferase, partial [Chloroflexi bacterium]|nr:site-specific DNA-methyltransferase [Chloroflexota bacterium]